MEPGSIYEVLHITSPVAITVISIALILSAGFAMTRLTKLLRLPNVTAYILAGILLGPFCFKLVPQQIIDRSDFLADIALAFIAFSVGEFFTLSGLKKNGPKVVVITLFEALVASVFVFILVYFVFGLSLPFSIVLAALASATAPASTMMTIRQTQSKGDFVDTLLQVVALDDAVSLIAYSVAISIALATMVKGDNAGANAWMVIRPILVNLIVLAVGGGFGFLLKVLMPKKRSTDNRLIITIAVLFAFCGLCAVLDVSPLLGCMSMGMVYINVTNDDKLFKQLNYFSPPILLLFFVRSGMTFRLDTLFSSGSVGRVPMIVVGVGYFLIRILGKYAGAFLGCLITGKAPRVRNYLGLALIPQAGVSIGLAALCARTLGPGIGTDLQTIILASSVLYEMIGPAAAKLSLYLSHSYSNKLEDVTDVQEVTESGAARPSVEVLIDRIQQIQKELPELEHKQTEEEDAFTEAAFEKYEQDYSPRRGRFLNS